MSSVLTCSVRAAAPVLLALQAAGVDRSMVASRLGIAPELLGEPDLRFPVSQLMFPLWDLAEESLNDPLVALRASEVISRETFGLFSYLVAASGTVGEAAQRAIRYFRLITEGGSYALEPDGECVWWMFAPANSAAAACTQDTIFALAVAVKHLRLWLAPDFAPTEVRFRQPELSGREQLERYFGTRLTLSADRWGFRFDRSRLDQRCALADPKLASFLEGYADEALAALPTPGLVSAKVRELLARGLKDGEASLRTVASGLALSERTLQRQLRHENTSLKQLIDDLRRELSTRYLRRADLSLSDVAYMLGFSETAPFFRAFKRWTGMTPGEFRRSLAAGLVDRPG